MKRASLIFFFALFLHYNFHPTNIGSVLLEKEGLFDEIIKGNDVDLLITHPGIYDIKLIDQSIKLRIWTNKCYGKLTVCYDSVDYESVQPPSICKKSKQTGFDLEIDPTRIRLIDGKFTPGKGHKNGCDETSYYNAGRPYIKPGYIITLNVIHASPYCSLIVRNASLDERAFIALPPKHLRPTPSSLTPTISTPSLSKPTTSQRSPTLTNLTPLSPPQSLSKRPSTPSPPSTSTSTFSTPLTWYENAIVELTWSKNAIDSLRKPWHFGLPIWFWIIVISFVTALFIIFLLLMGLCIYVKCIQKRKCQPKVYEVPKLSNKKLKIEGSKESKEFKEKIQDQSKSTVEAIAVSSVNPPASTLLPATLTQLPPSDSTKLEDDLKSTLKLSLLQPSPTTTTTNSTTDGSSKKSQITTTTDSSLPEEEEAVTQALTTTNKKVSIEPHYASLLRNGCLGKNNSSKAREMRRQYPRNIGRTLQHREIKLFTLTSNEMFFEVDKMWYVCFFYIDFINSFLFVYNKEAERDLKTKGIKFDEKKGIIKMTENGRKFIESSKTLDFIAYFSFGAEYFEFIDSDLVQFCKLSIPLLFTISMIPRIDESKRRKALTSIRRQIPKIREQFSSSSSAFAGYETMAFPINAIVKAYEMSKNGVENLDKLLTIGRALMEEKTQRDSHQAADTLGLLQELVKRKKN